jgi:hypothetical protein
MFDITDLLGLAALEEAQREQEEEDRLEEERREREDRHRERVDRIMQERADRGYSRGYGNDYGIGSKIEPEEDNYNYEILISLWSTSTHISSARPHPQKSFRSWSLCQCRTCSLEKRRQNCLHSSCRSK